MPLPDDLDPLLGVYVAHMGPICANGLLHAAADLHGPDVRALGDGVRGRRVAVVGAGVVGAADRRCSPARHGAAEVVVLDPTPQRRAVAEALGLAALDPDADDPAVVLKTPLAARPRRPRRGRGVPVPRAGARRCTGAAAAAPAGHRDRPRLLPGRRGRGPARRGVPPQRAVACAARRSAGCPRGLAHAWDRERLSAETIELLRAHGAGVREHLVTDVVPFDEAPGAARRPRRPPPPRHPGGAHV